MKFLFCISVCLVVGFLCAQFNTGYFLPVCFGLIWGFYSDRVFDKFIRKLK